MTPHAESLPPAFSKNHHIESSSAIKAHMSKVEQLHSRADYFFAKFEQGREINYLDEAIVLDREALELCPQGHLARSVSLTFLAIHLWDRFNQTGAMMNLDEAIVLDREALELCPRGHSDRLMSLNNLAVHLSTRYDQLGAIEDLNEAIALYRDALAVCPPGDPDRCFSLNNLANGLSTRYKELRAMGDLDEAIVLGRDTLEHRPPEDTDRSMSLSNLAVDLYTRYKQLGGMEDLDEAIVLDRNALAFRPPGHPDRLMTLNNLAINHSERYKQLGEMRDLDEAIALDREALWLCPPGHPLRANSLHGLASRLHTRFMQLSKAEDREELFGLYAEPEHVPQAVASDDLSATKAWIDAAEYFQHPTTLLTYEIYLRSLIQHLATLPSLPQHHDLIVFKKLTSSLAVDAFSACLRNHASTSAVELLELGREVFWNQFTFHRSPLDAVTVFHLAGKTLADEFMRLTSLIHNALSSPDPAHYDPAQDLNIRLQRVVSDIRHLPGLSRFLLPPLFLDLQLAASGGPVIIVNASRYSCDALIVLPDGDPVHIPLQIKKARVRELSSKLRVLTVNAKRVDVTGDLYQILRELWDHVISPIVNFLLTAHPSQSRIWWCPTAEFSLLPLHAAGPYREGHQNLDDIYISSYTPTLTALIRARRRYPSCSATQRKQIVAIGQPRTKGETEYVSVGTELASIARRFGDLATFTRIEGPECCISRVSDELRGNQWVHLACHGLLNLTQPMESGFALRDGHFTIQRIIHCGLENPQFAYLSSCHTTVGDEESQDEAIHLASSMQFAGFRSVVGTMWAMDDGEMNKITSMFYDNMMDGSGCLDHTRAAFALHKTIKKSVDIPFDQRIVYIHLGA